MGMIPTWWSWQPKGSPGLVLVWRGTWEWKFTVLPAGCMTVFLSLQFPGAPARTPALLPGLAAVPGGLMPWNHVRAWIYTMDHNMCSGTLMQDIHDFYYCTPPPSGTAWGFQVENARLSQPGHHLPVLEASGWFEGQIYVVKLGWSLYEVSQCFGSKEGGSLEGSHTRALPIRPLPEKQGKGYRYHRFRTL